MRINTKVFPGSGKQEIIKVGDNEYKIYLKNPAKDNKANLELLKLMQKYGFKNIKIIKGMKSKNKIIEICKDDLKNIKIEKDFKYKVVTTFSYSIVDEDFILTKTVKECEKVF